MSLDSTIQQDELSKEPKQSMSPLKQISTNNYSINPPVVAEQDSSEESDEILIVEVQLGQNVKTQLQIARSQNIDEVSRQFCLQHCKLLSVTCRVESQLRAEGGRDTHECNLELLPQGR